MLKTDRDYMQDTTFVQHFYFTCNYGLRQVICGYVGDGKINLFGNCIHLLGKIKSLYLYSSSSFSLLKDFRIVEKLL